MFGVTEIETELEAPSISTAGKRAIALPQTAPAAKAQTENAPEAMEPPAPIRVAWVAGPETPQRLGAILAPLAVGLMDELVEVVALCPRTGGEPQLPSPPLDIVPYTPERWLGASRGTVEALGAELHKRKIAVLHCLEAAPWRLTARLSARANLPVLVSSYSLRDVGKLGRLPAGVAGVLAPSTPLKDELVHSGVAGEDRVHLLRPGVLAARHSTCFTEPQCRASILAAGVLSDLPAYEALLRAFAAVRDSQHDCAFFIVGSGKAEREIRALAEKLALRHELTFADDQPLERLQDILKGADIFISPTASPALDLPCLLAMAAGAPVLGVGGGVDDFLKEGETAWLFGQGQGDEITGRLMQALDDRASARALAESALTYLRTHHSPADGARRLAAIYRRAASGGSTP